MGTLPGDGFPTRLDSLEGHVLKGKRAKVLVSPPRLSVEARSRRNLPNGIEVMGPATKANTDTDAAEWHALSVGEVVKRLATNGEKGLDSAEASARLQKYGPNLLPEGKKRGPFMRFLAQFNNILVYVLLGAGFTKLMLNLWVDASIIFSVVVLNALLGFMQEGKAEKALDSIRNMLSAEARTVRRGETRMIPAAELVPGDVLILEPPHKIP